MKGKCVRFLLLLALSIGLAGCSGANNSVEKPENPVPPPKNAPQKAGTSSNAELP